MDKKSIKIIEEEVKKSKTPPQKKPTPEENAAAEKRVRAAMKKAGCKTLEEYIRYVDKKRGY